MKERIEYIRIEMVSPNLRLCYPKEVIDGLQSFLRSKADYDPIEVYFDGDYFRILDGEKRWRACKRLGMPFVRAVIVESGQSGGLFGIRNHRRLT